jgi:hypothetical protein
MAFPNEPLTKYQQMIWDIYGVADDRLYSNWDVFSNMERFTMWALKGIRKGKIDIPRPPKLIKPIILLNLILMAIPRLV